MVWGGTSQNSPPAPFLCGVCVCHTVPLGVTRSPRCAAPWDLGQLLRPGAPLGRGAPWSTSGCGTPMGPRAPLGARAPWVLEHPRSWSTHLGHARSWSSQWDLVLQLRAGLSHTSPFPQKGTLGSLRAVPAHPACKDPPRSPQLHSSLPLALGTHLGQCQPPSPPREIPVPGGNPAPQECPVPAPQQSPRCSSPKPSSLQKCSRGAAASCEQALSQPNSCRWNRPGQLERPYKDHQVLLMQTSVKPTARAHYLESLS